MLAQSRQRCACHRQRAEYIDIKLTSNLWSSIKFDGSRLGITRIVDQAGEIYAGLINFPKRCLDGTLVTDIDDQLHAGTVMDIRQQVLLSARWQ